METEIERINSLKKNLENIEGYDRGLGDVLVYQCVGLVISGCLDKNGKVVTFAPLELLYYLYEEKVENKPRSELDEIVETKVREKSDRDIKTYLKHMRKELEDKPITPFFTVIYKLAILHELERRGGLFEEIMNNDPSKSIASELQRVLYKIIELDKKIETKKANEVNAKANEANQTKLELERDSQTREKPSNENSSQVNSSSVNPSSINSSSSSVSGNTHSYVKILEEDNGVRKESIEERGRQ